MPANKRALFRRRRSVQNTRKITPTMEMVATARLPRAKRAALAARPYTAHLQRMIAHLAAAAADGDDESSLACHPLLVPRPVRRAVLVVLTSDRGLCGSFNSGTLRLARRHYQARVASGQEVEIIAGGRKGLRTLRHWKLPVARKIEGRSEVPEYRASRTLARSLIERYAAGEIDEAAVAYSYFDSMMRQSPRVERIVPCTGMGVIDGARGEEPREAERPGRGPREYIFHPDPTAIAGSVLPLVVQVTLYATMLESAAGEQAARRVAMKNATDNADEMIKILTRTYNRARQTQITMELLEVMGGAEALAAGE